VGTGSDTTEFITKFHYAQMGNMMRLIPLRKASRLVYVVPDHLGGTLRVVDTAGNTIDDIRYHAFGGTRSGGTSLQTEAPRPPTEDPRPVQAERCQDTAIR